jgi:hypothetical protein
MKFIPFPSTLARISAETGRRLQSSDQDDAGRHRPRSALPRPYTANGVAAYRWPDGRVAPAYDMYAPQHPEGAEPGLARIHYEVRHHANDTSSYEPKILTFRSVPDLEAEGMIVDRTAAGLLRHDLQAALVVTIDEAAMAEVEAALPADAELIREPIRRVGDAAAPMAHFLATWTRAARLEVMGASSEEALHAAARERYPFIPDEGDFAGFAEALRKHGRKHGWVVAAGDLEALGRGVEAMDLGRKPALETEDGPGL